MKLHLPKQLFTALLAALTLATPATLSLGSTAWGAEVFDSITKGGNFYAGSYSFSFVLDDAATNGSVVAAFWGDGQGTAALGSNAFTVVAKDDGTYELYVGRGQLNNTDINESTTFNKNVNEASGAVFVTTLQAGVLYTITGGSTGGAGNATATIDSAYMEAETCGGYNGNMNGSTLSSGVNSAYAVSGGSNAVVWKATSVGASATDTTNWQTITNQTPAAIGDTSVLVFEAVNNLSKSVDVTGLNAVRSIKVYDDYTFNATDATTLTTTSGLTIASGKTLMLEDNVTLSISSTIRGAGTLALEGGTLHVADYSTLDDFAYTFSNNADGFRTGFSATLTEGTISTLADALNITIEGAAYKSYADGRLTATLNKEDIFYINTSRNYDDIKTSATGATGITVSSTGTLSIASSDTDWFEEGTFDAAVPVSNAGNIVLDCSVTEGVSLNSLFGGSDITQTSAGTTTISGAKAVSTSANLSTSGTVKISGAESFANNENTLTLDKLVLENVTEATIDGTDSGTGKVSGTIEVLGKSKLILTGSQDLLGWSGGGDYTDKILLRGTNAENKATLQLDTRQTCSTAIVMEGYSTILNGGNAAVQNNKTDNNAGILQMHNGGSITATGTDNTFSAILYTNKATSIAVTNTGDTLLIDGVVRGDLAITKTGDGTLTFSGNMAWQNGRINVNDGIVVLDDAATLGSSDYVVANGAELQVSGVTRETFSNAVSGTGTLTKTGAGTLTMDGNLSVSNVKATGGTLKLTGTLGTGTYTATGGNITLGSMTVNSGVQLNLASTNGHSINAESGSVITNNGTINLSGVFISSSGGYKGDTAFGDATKQFISLISSISGGQVQLHTGAFAFQLGGGSNAPTEVVFNAAYSNGGDLRLANYNKTTQWKVGSNASLTVSGQLWLDHKQELNIDGGQVSATSMRLGYDINQHGSIINLSSGSLTTGKITLSDHSGTHKTAINMSGGELTFTNSTTLEGNGKVDISITGGTLKATTSDWTLTGSDTQVVSLGNAAFDIAAGQSITLSGAMSLTGTLTHSGAGELVFNNSSLSMSQEALNSLRITSTELATGTNGFSTLQYHLVNTTGSGTTSGTATSVQVGDASLAFNATTGIISSAEQTFVINGTYSTAEQDAVENLTNASLGIVVGETGQFTISGAVSDDLTVNTILSSTAGTGTLVLDVDDVTLNKDLTLSNFHGKLQVKEGRTLTVDERSKLMDLTNLQEIELQAGATMDVGYGTGVKADTIKLNSDSVLQLQNGGGDYNTLEADLLIAGDATLKTSTFGNATEVHGSISGNAVLSIEKISDNDWILGSTISDGTGEGDALALHFTQAPLIEEGVVRYVYITGDNSYSGGTTVDEGHIKTGHVNALGTGNVTLEESAALILESDLNIQGALNSAGAVTMGDNTTLALGGGTAEKRKEHSIGTLSGAAAGVTLGDYATLTLGDGSTTTTHTIGTLSGGTGSKLNLAQHSVLNKVNTISGTVTLTGSGKYNYGTIGQSAPALNVNLDSENWTGVVGLNTGADSLNLTELNSINSKLELTGLTGYLGGSNTANTVSFTRNLILVNGDGGYGIKLNNGWANYNANVEFSGTIEGDGNIWYSWNSGSGKTATHTFTNNTGNWSGEFVRAENAAKDVVVKFTHGGSVFKDDSTDITVGVRDANATSKTDVVINAAENTTFNGILSNIRELQVQSNTTFNRNVSTGSATVDSDVTAKVNSTLTAGTVQLGEAATITGKQGADATMSKVQMSSTGITGTAQDGSSSIANADIEIAQLAQDASFTIQDMTLTNTTITAATVDIRNSKVSGNVVLNVVKPIEAEAITAPDVSQGVTEGKINFSYGLALEDNNSSLTLNMEVPQAILPSESGLYTLTITLNGFAEDFDFSKIDSQVVFGADSWLGRALVNQKAEYTVVTAQTPATAGESGVPTVSYDATSNVGSLVITITGLNVPEPTTATLSLLALAALAARRRRK